MTAYDVAGLCNQALILWSKTKHRKPSTEFPDGGIFKMEAPIHISNVMLVDGGEAVKTGRKLNESGKLQRFNKSTGEFIK